MKYRTKLTLILVTLALITNGVVMGISYFLSRRILLESIQSQVLSIAATAASFIDGDLHAQIRDRADEDSQAYLKLEEQFRRVRNVNRRPDVHIRYVYSMVPSTQVADGAQFVVDGQEHGSQDKSHVGDQYVPLTPQIEPFDVNAYRIEPLVKDEFGSFLSANAPIRDSSNQAVAALGVDMATDDVMAKTNLLLWSGLAAVGVATAVAVGLSLVQARFVTRSLDLVSRAVGRIGAGDLEARVELQTKDEFSQLGQAVNQMAAALRDRELLKGALARYLSYQVAESVIREGRMPQLKGERRKITVMFLDIRNFTALSEKIAPEKVVQLLNQCFEKLIDVVFKHKGTLDKFTGDGLMAIFGAPFDDDQQELHAVSAALEMQDALKELRQKWQADDNHHPIKVGIGINTGFAIVGNIGSNQRMDYTAIGDAVNIAARLESATKDHQANILVSETTYQALSAHFMKYIGAIQLKGMSHPVPTYSVGDSQTDPDQQLAIV